TPASSRSSGPPALPPCRIPPWLSQSSGCGVRADCVTLPSSPSSAEPKPLAMSSGRRSNRVFAISAHPPAGPDLGTVLLPLLAGALEAELLLQVARQRGREI